MREKKNKRGKEGDVKWQPLPFSILKNQVPILAAGPYFYFHI